MEEDEAGEEGWEDPTRTTERGTKMIATARYGSNPPGQRRAPTRAKIFNLRLAFAECSAYGLSPIDLAYGLRALSVVLGGYK